MGIFILYKVLIFDSQLFSGNSPFLKIIGKGVYKYTPIEYIE